MNDLDFMFPDSFAFEGSSYRGQRVTSKNQLLILLKSDDCPFDIGDVLHQSVGTKQRPFEVLDYDVSTSMDIAGHEFPFIARLKVKALDVKSSPSHVTTHLTFNGAINAHGDFQAGSNNSITKNITIEQLQDAIENSNDPEVKSLWQKLLENPTFASLASTLAKGVIGQ